MRVPPSFHITSVFCSRIQSGIPYCVQSLSLKLWLFLSLFVFHIPVTFTEYRLIIECLRFGFVVPFIFKEGICQCSCHFLIWFWSKPGQRDWAIRRRPDVLFAQTVVLYLWRLLVGVMDFLDAQLLKNPSAMQESLVQYQLRRPSPFTGMILLRGSLTILWCIQKSLSKFKTAGNNCMPKREKSFQGVNQTWVWLVHACLLETVIWSRGAIIMANKSKQYLVITTCQEPC